MTDTMSATSASTRAPWHLWVVGGLALLWNGYGAYDYVMSQTGGEDYLRAYGMTEAQIEYFNALPSGMIAVWAVGVWGALLGAVLLLLRRKWAFAAFIASGAAFFLSLVYQFGLSNGAEIMGSTAAVMSTVIAIACLFFIWYARLMTKRGVLR